LRQRKYDVSQAYRIRLVFGIFIPRSQEAGHAGPGPCAADSINAASFFAASAIPQSAGAFARSEEFPAQKRPADPSTLLPPDIFRYLACDRPPCVAQIPYRIVRRTFC